MKHLTFILFSAGLIFLLAACGVSTEDIDANVQALIEEQVTQIVDTATPLPAAVSTPLPTPTLEPSPTGTPKPTPTDIRPEPNPTPSPPINKPPFKGTLFVSSEILNSSDLTLFSKLVKTLDSSRTMFDRRINGWITVTPYIFQAAFLDGLTVEVQVNPEFENAIIAEQVALKYVRVIGQLPTLLRKDVETIWIHKGDQLFGGGNNNLLIHHDQGLTYEDQGFLEEAFLHEAAHTSLDNYHLSTSEWAKAQQADGQFISDYAKEFPLREDIAESFTMYFALRYKTSRIDPDILRLIENTIPNRIGYFDQTIPDLLQGFNRVKTVTSSSTATPIPVAKESVLEIDIKNYKFQDITVNLGEVVQWRNLDLDMHSTTSGNWGSEDAGNLWDSGKVSFGEVFEFKFMES